MAKTIFFSYAGEFDNKKTHNPFIKKSLKYIAKQINNHFVEISERDNTEDIKRSVLESNDYITIDSATNGISGSPDIANSIFDKISKCAFFVCDLSIATEETVERNGLKFIKYYPNPNVLIELGYALSVLGSQRIAIIFDEELHKNVVDLPFDVNHLRIIKYKGDNKFETLMNKWDGKSKPKGKIYTFIDSIKRCLPDFDTIIEDDMKLQIDSIFIAYAKFLSDCLYCLETTKYSFETLLDISRSEVESLLSNVDEKCIFYLNFYIHWFMDWNPKIPMNNFDPNPIIQQMLLQLMAGNYYDRKWIKCFVKFQNFIRTNVNFISGIAGSIPNFYFVDQNKKEFVNTIIGFQIVVKEWLSVTNRKSFDNLKIMLPKGGCLQIQFEETRNYCYIKNGSEKFIIENGQKKVVTSKRPDEWPK